MIVYFGRVNGVDSNLVHEISRSFFSRSTLLEKKNLSAVQSWSSFRDFLSPLSSWAHSFHKILQSFDHSLQSWERFHKPWVTHELAANTAVQANFARNVFAWEVTFFYSILLSCLNKHFYLNPAWLSPRHCHVSAISVLIHWPSFYLAFFPLTKRGRDMRAFIRGVNILLNNNLVKARKLLCQWNVSNQN